MSTKVRSAPVGLEEDMLFYKNLFEHIQDRAIQMVDILKTYTNKFAQINSTLSDLVPKASDEWIILFTIIFWSGTLALNTLPALKEINSYYVYPSLPPYKVYILTTVYALLLGAAGTSVYNPFFFKKWCFRW